VHAFVLFVDGVKQNHSGRIFTKFGILSGNGDGAVNYTFSDGDAKKTRAVPRISCKMLNLCDFVKLYGIPFAVSVKLQIRDKRTKRHRRLSVRLSVVCVMGVLPTGEGSAMFRRGIKSFKGGHTPGSTTKHTKFVQLIKILPLYATFKAN